MIELEYGVGAKNAIAVVGAPWNKIGQFFGFYWDFFCVLCRGFISVPSSWGLPVDVSENVALFTP